MITNEQLDALERRYLPADQQKCVVCGASLQFSSSGDRHSPGTRYNCSSDDASPIRSKRPLREKLDHYDRSTWYDRGEACMAVVEVIRAYRATFGILVRWAPYQEFGIPDPAAEETEAPEGPVVIGAVGYRGNDITVYWRRPEGKAPYRREPDNAGAGDRWEDPRDTYGGLTDHEPAEYPAE